MREDRKLKPRILERLDRELKAGYVRPFLWATVYVKETKGTYRANGKHSSYALCHLNGAFPKNATVIIEKYEADTLEDAAKLYATFDYREGARSVHDINRTYAAAIPALAKLPARTIGLSVSGISYALWEGKSNYMGADVRAGMLGENIPFIRWLHQLFYESKEKDSRGRFPHVKHILRLSVVAAIYRTYNTDKKAAYDFWSAVRDGSVPNPTDPTRKVQKMLQDVRIGRDGSDTRAVYVRCLHGWNAWRKGVGTDLKYYPKVATPMVV